MWPNDCVNYNVVFSFRQGPAIVTHAPIICPVCFVTSEINDKSIHFDRVIQLGSFAVPNDKGNQSIYSPVVKPTRILATFRNSNNKVFDANIYFGGLKFLFYY